jgi:hypothetical protein
VIRTLVEKVEVTARTEETIYATIYWVDGSEPSPVEARLARFAHRIIRELAAEGFSNAEIARRVNKVKLTTLRGKPWTRETVWVVRFGKGKYRRSA